MNPGRVAVLACVLLAASLLVSTTGAFDQIESSRGIGVAVADHENAFLEIRTDETTGTNGSEIRLFVLHNNFGQDVHVESVSTDSSLIDVRSNSGDDIQSGGHHDVTAVCERVGNRRVTVAIAVEGEGVAVTTRKRVRIECGPRSTPDPPTPTHNPSTSAE